jgi:tRNA (guanine-N7-)-methyltransferase
MILIRPATIYKPAKYNTHEYSEENMRLKNVPGSREAIAESEYTIKDAEGMKGKWHEFFGNNNPIHIEIGMGKGTFIMELARRNPDINYIGIEKYSSVLIRAVEKRIQEPEMKNLYFIRMEAEYIENVFDKEEVAYIYLNFSDPWPKDRHAKRRLTSRQFLKRYEGILAPGGGITFKTDNVSLFDFSLVEVEEAGWKLENFTRDLHHSEYVEGNIMTEYEKKFSEMGNPICRLVAFPPETGKSSEE